MFGDSDVISEQEAGKFSVLLKESKRLKQTYIGRKEDIRRIKVN